jgi:hypothetical protein
MQGSWSRPSYGGQERYYQTNSGRLLMVTNQGSVYDVTCIGIEWIKAHPQLTDEAKLSHMRNTPECSAGQIMELGKVYWDKETEDWQLTKYDIAPAPKQCKSLFLPLSDMRLRHACWNVLWEVPADIVMIPVYVVAAPFVVGGLLYFWAAAALSGAKHE